MTDQQGYFAFHRQFWGSWLSPIARGMKFDDGMAWFYLISEAAIKDRVKFYNGTNYDLKRGEVLISYRDLSKKWKWHRDTVQRFIKHLASKHDPEITIVRIYKNCTIARINKYDSYQPYSPKNAANGKKSVPIGNPATDAETAVISHLNRPLNRPMDRPMDRPILYKKTDKRINTHPPTPQGESECFEKFFAGYPRQEAKARTLAVWWNKQLDPRFDEIMAGLTRYKQSETWNRDGGRYITHPEKFLEDEIWTGHPRPVGGTPPPKKPEHYPSLLQAARIINRYFPEEVLCGLDYEYLGGSGDAVQLRHKVHRTHSIQAADYVVDDPLTDKGD